MESRKTIGTDPLNTSSEIPVVLQETPNQPSIEPQYTEASPMCIGLSVGNTITAIKKRMEDLLIWINNRNFYCWE